MSEVLLAQRSLEYLVRRDERSFHAIFEDVRRSGRREATPSFLARIERFKPPLEEEPPDTRFVLINGEEFRQDERNPSFILGSAKRRGFMRPHPTAALRLGEKCSQADLGDRRLIICCQAIRVADVNRPDLSKRYFLGLDRWEGKDRLFLPRTNKGIKYSFLPDDVFAFCLP